MLRRVFRSPEHPFFLEVVSVSILDCLFATDEYGEGIEIWYNRTAKELMVQDSVTPRVISAGRDAPILERFAFRSLRTYTYKNTPQSDLVMAVHFPYDHVSGDRRPGILFFFGGGFVCGTREQFTRQCAYFASRGMVAATADYRVRSYHETGPDACVEDALDAMRWFRQHAAELGVDPERIVVGGGSAGGSLAAAIGAYSTDGSMDEEASRAVRPFALALFNPALRIAGSDLQRRLGMSDSEVTVLDFDGRIGASYPPTWMWYGEDDSIYHRSKPTIERMRGECARIELEIVPEADHGFFNDFEPFFRSSLSSLDAFLMSLDILP